MDINLTDKAQAVVNESVKRGSATLRAERGEAKIDYKTYVTEQAVTHDNRPEHVKVFREAFKAANPKATGSEIRAYATKVRNGLGHHLPEKESNAAVTLRVSLSGEGGGSTVVATDHPLYEQIAALVTGQVPANA